MSKKLYSSLFVVTVVASTFTTQAQADSRHCFTRTARATYTATASSAGRVVYKLVQHTPQYDIRRPEVVSGSRVTLFANFLRNEAGYVMFELNGTSTQCTIVEWQPNSVTVELPCLGLNSPKNAEIQIILPDGRIAKTFPVLLVSQPDIVIHDDTIPQPMPPAPGATSAVYATPVNGGLLLQAGSE